MKRPIEIQSLENKELEKLRQSVFKPDMEKFSIMMGLIKRQFMLKSMKIEHK